MPCSPLRARIRFPAPTGGEPPGTAQDFERFSPHLLSSFQRGRPAARARRRFSGSAVSGFRRRRTPIGRSAIPREGPAQRFVAIRRGVCGTDKHAAYESLPRASSGSLVGANAGRPQRPDPWGLHPTRASWVLFIHQFDSSNPPLGATGGGEERAVRRSDWVVGGWVSREGRWSGGFQKRVRDEVGRRASTNEGASPWR